MNPMPKQKRWKSEKYLEFIRKQPCIVCGYKTTQAHHIRFANNSGTASKPSDTWTIPLCKLHHLEYHQIGRDTFYDRHGVDVFLDLFTLTRKYIETSWDLQG